MLARSRKAPQRGQLAFNLRLKNCRTKRILEAWVFLPETKEYIGDTVDKNYTYWICSLTTKKNGRIKSRTVSGDTWIGALLLAIEFIRRMIPDDQEQDWKTDDGLPSWVIFPKEVAIGWGYEFHKKLWKLVQSEEKKLNERIARKYRNGQSGQER
jgi:hypothetical protein